MAEMVVSEALGMAFDEPFNYPSMVAKSDGWSPSIRADMLKCCCFVGDVLRELVLLQARLRGAPASPGAGPPGPALRTAESLAGKALDAAELCLSRDLQFHACHRDLPLLTPECDFGSAFAEAEVPPRDADCAQEPAAALRWENLACVLNYYYQTGTLGAVRELAASPAAPLELRASAARVVHVVAQSGLVTPAACRDLVSFALPVLADLGRQADGGALEASLAPLQEQVPRLSALLSHLHAVVRDVGSARDLRDAVEGACRVQMAAIRLLVGGGAHASFWRVLAAAKELDRILARLAYWVAREAEGRAGAGDSPSAGPGPADSPVEAVSGWLAREGVVGLLLRNHLHQRQFVDLLRKVLGRLVALGLLEPAHLERLWGLATRDHTFPAVREHALELIGSLAPSLEPEALRLLLARVEASALRRGADIGPALELLGELVASDKRASMAGPVLRFLWDLACMRSHLRRFVSSGMVRRAVVHYVDAWAGPGLSPELGALLRGIRQGLSDPALAPPALAVSQQLLGLTHGADRLRHWQGLLTGLLRGDAEGSSGGGLPDGDVTVGSVISLAVWLASAPPGGPGEAPRPAAGWDVDSAAAALRDTGMSAEDLIGAALDVALRVLEQEGRPLSLPEAERLWPALLGHPRPAVVELGTAFFDLVAQAGRVPPEVAAATLSWARAHMDPARLSEPSLRSLVALLAHGSPGLDLVFEVDEDTGEGGGDPGLDRRDAAAAARGAATLVRGPGAVDPAGLELVWDAYLSSGDAAVVSAARGHLLVAHQCRAAPTGPRDPPDGAGETPPAEASSLSACRRRGAEELMARCCGELRCARAGLESGDPASTERARRVLDVVRRGLQEIDEDGGSDGGRVPHGMSFAGPKLRVRVVFAGVDGTVPPQDRPRRVEIHCNAPVGVLRAEVADAAGVHPGQVRLVLAGRELGADAASLPSCGVTHATTVHAMLVPKEAAQQRLAQRRRGSRPAADPGTRCPLRSWAAGGEEGRGIYPLLLGVVRVAGAGSVVREEALAVLDGLWTCPATLAVVLDALRAADPRSALQGVLTASGPGLPGGAAGGDPAWLAYAIETVRTVVDPVQGSAEAEGREAHREHLRAFVGSGCASVMLEVAMDVLRQASASSDDLLGLRLASTCVAALECVAPGALSLPDSDDEGPGSDPEDAQGAGTADADGDDVAGRAMRFLAEAVSVANGARRSEAAEAAAAGGGAAASPSEDAGRSAGLAVQALSAMSRVLKGRPWLLPELLSLPGAEDVVVTPLVSGPDVVRRATKGLLVDSLGALRGAVPSPGPGRRGEECAARTVRLLRARRPSLASPGASSEEYFDLMHELLIPEPREGVEGPAPLPRELLEEIQEEEIGLLLGLRGAGEVGEPLLLEQLDLLRALFGELDNADAAALAPRGPAGESLVRGLLERFLFPEGAAGVAGALARIGSPEGHQAEPSVVRMAFEEALGGGAGGDALAVVTRAASPVCETEDARSKALALLGALARHGDRTMREVVAWMLEHQYTPPLPAPLGPGCAFADTASPYGRVALRRRGEYAGLVNASATCYMNSVIQQLFMQPSIRRGVLAAAVTPDPGGAGGDRPADGFVDDIMVQFQSVFAHLAGSVASAHEPRGFWRSFKDYDGEPVDVREHQDAFEFLGRLMDLLDQRLLADGNQPVLKNVVGGKFVQQCVSRECSCVSESLQDFMSVSLDVQGHDGLLQSLAAYFEGELLEGENAFHCSRCDRKVDALKRVLVREAPHTLVVHLKRFEWDYHTGTRSKIRDRFAFPHAFDLAPFTVAGRAALDAAAGDGADGAGAAGAGAAGAGAAPPEEATRGGTRYRLRGVVVHTGSAFAGHYYSFIQERRPDGAPGQWYVFDDSTVSEWDVERLEEDCFGGSVSKPGAGGGDRPNSAYMLLYEREDEGEPCDLEGRLLPGCPRPAPLRVDTRGGGEHPPGPGGVTPVSESLGQRLQLGGSLTPKRELDPGGDGAARGYESEPSTPLKRPRTEAPAEGPRAEGSAPPAGSPGASHPVAAEAEAPEAPREDGLVDGRCGRWDHRVRRRVLWLVAGQNLALAHQNHLQSQALWSFLARLARGCAADLQAGGGAATGWEHLAPRARVAAELQGSRPVLALRLASAYLATTYLRLEPGGQPGSGKPRAVFLRALRELVRSGPVAAMTLLASLGPHAALGAPVAGDGEAEGLESDAEACLELVLDATAGARRGALFAMHGTAPSGAASTVARQCMAQAVEVLAAGEDGDGGGCPPALSLAGRALVARWVDDRVRLLVHVAGFKQPPAASVQRAVEVLGEINASLRDLPGAPPVSPEAFRAFALHLGGLAGLVHQADCHRQSFGDTDAALHLYSLARRLLSHSNAPALGTEAFAAQHPASREAALERLRGAAARAPPLFAELPGFELSWEEAARLAQGPLSELLASAAVAHAGEEAGEEACAVARLVGFHSVHALAPLAGAWSAAVGAADADTLLAHADSLAAVLCLDDLLSQWRVGAALRPQPPPGGSRADPAAGGGLLAHLGAAAEDGRHAAATGLLSVVLALQRHCVSRGDAGGLAGLLEALRQGPTELAMGVASAARVARRAGRRPGHRADPELARAAEAAARDGDDLLRRATGRGAAAVLDGMGGAWAGLQVPAGRVEPPAAGSDGSCGSGERDGALGPPGEALSGEATVGADASDGPPAPSAPVAGLVHPSYGSDDSGVRAPEDASGPDPGPDSPPEVNESG